MFDEIREWGVSRGLTGPNGKATVEGQLLKLDEEHAELEEAISLLKIADEYEYSDYQIQTQDAIGDMTVVLVLLADLLGLRFEDCVQGALDVISKRTGTMVNGVFVKSKEA